MKMKIGIENPVLYIFKTRYEERVKVQVFINIENFRGLYLIIFIKIFFNIFNYMTMVGYLISDTKIFIK